MELVSWAVPRTAPFGREWILRWATRWVPLWTPQKDLLLVREWVPELDLVLAEKTGFS